MEKIQKFGNINESGSSSERFTINYTECFTKIQSIEHMLIDMKHKFSQDSKNWGFVGSISHVNEELTEIEQFLKGE